MIEWATLVLLVPLVLVPIVLLFGFAGCAREMTIGTGPPEPPPDMPFGLTATARGESEIQLAWQHSALGGVTFIVAMAGPDGAWNDHYGETAEKTFLSKGLAPGTVFSFRVRARAPYRGESGPSNVATARTWIWRTAYDAATASNDSAFAGDCLVQRIDRGILKHVTGATVKRIRLALRGSVNQSGTPLSIAQITISHAAPGPLPGNPQPDAWDSEPPLTLLGPASLPGDGSLVQLQDVDFPLSPGKDLLVAVDISAANTNQTSRVTTAVGNSRCFVNSDAAEAEKADRSSTGWTERSGVYLVSRIEVLVA